MQNIFFKAGGKHGSDHVTIYRNTHVLVLFKNPLDNTVIHTITQCISRRKKYGELVDMLHHMLDHHRYIVIMGDLKTSPKLKYHTDIFATDPTPHQTIYHLENKILAEKKSFPCVMSPASVKSFLCQYHKQTNIYYSTWSFENVAKICPFQVLDPLPHTH